LISILFINLNFCSVVILIFSKCYFWFLKVKTLFLEDVGLVYDSKII